MKNRIYCFAVLVFLVFSMFSCNVNTEKEEFASLSISSSLSSEFNSIGIEDLLNNKHVAISNISEDAEYNGETTGATYEATYYIIKYSLDSYYYTSRNPGEKFYLALDDNYQQKITIEEFNNITRLLGKGSDGNYYFESKDGKTKWVFLGEWTYTNDSNDQEKLIELLKSTCLTFESSYPFAIFAKEGKTWDGEIIPFSNPKDKYIHNGKEIKKSGEYWDGSVLTSIGMKGKYYVFLKGMNNTKFSSSIDGGRLTNSIVGLTTGVNHITGKPNMISGQKPYYSINGNISNLLNWCEQGYLNVDTFDFDGLFRGMESVWEIDLSLVSYNHQPSNPCKLSHDLFKIGAEPIELRYFIKDNGSIISYIDTRTMGVKACGKSETTFTELPSVMFENHSGKQYAYTISSDQDGNIWLNSVIDESKANAYWSVLYEEAYNELVKHSVRIVSDSMMQIETVSNFGGDPNDDPIINWDGELNIYTFTEEGILACASWTGVGISATDRALYGEDKGKYVYFLSGIDNTCLSTGSNGSILLWLATENAKVYLKGDVRNLVNCKDKDAVDALTVDPLVDFFKIDKDLVNSRHPYSNPFWYAKNIDTSELVNDNDYSIFGYKSKLFSNRLVVSQGWYDDKITLEWDKIPSANEYTIYRQNTYTYTNTNPIGDANSGYTSSGSSQFIGLTDWEEIGRTKDTHYTDTTAVRNERHLAYDFTPIAYESVNYYYIVVSSNAIDECLLADSTYMSNSQGFEMDMEKWRDVCIIDENDENEPYAKNMGFLSEDIAPTWYTGDSFGFYGPKNDAKVKYTITAYDFKHRYGEVITKYETIDDNGWNIYDYDLSGMGNVIISCKVEYQENGETVRSRTYNYNFLEASDVVEWHNIIMNWIIEKLDRAIGGDWWYVIQATGRDKTVYDPSGSGSAQIKVRYTAGTRDFDTSVFPQGFGRYGGVFKVHGWSGENAYLWTDEVWYSVTGGAGNTDNQPLIIGRHHKGTATITLPCGYQAEIEYKNLWRDKHRWHKLFGDVTCCFRVNCLWNNPISGRHSGPVNVNPASLQYKMF